MTIDWNIAGHTSIRKILETQFTAQDFSHAYIFSGPKHVGKHALAIQLAASQLCARKDQSTPCRTCTSCVQVEKNMHPDLLVVDVLENKKSISIDQVVALQSKLLLKSNSNTLRFCIIPEAELLSIEAANRLLKFLEEPPRYVVFVLITPSLQALLPTIQSRCQLFRFTIPSRDELGQYFTNLSEKQFHEYYELAQGRPGKIFELQDNPEIQKQQNQLVEHALQLLLQTTAKPLSSKSSPYVERLNKTRSVMQLWFVMLHDIVLVQHGLEPRYFIQHKDELELLANRLTTNKVAHAGHELLQQYHSLDYNPDVYTVIHYSQLLFV